MTNRIRTILSLTILALGAAVLSGCSGTQHTWNDNSSLEPNRMYTCNVPASTSATCQVITVVPANNR